MKHNLLKSVIISVILLLGANSVWAWQSWHLIGNYQGSWDINNKQNLSGTIENGKYFISVYHSGTQNYFRLYSNNHYGPSTSKELPDAGEQGGYNGTTHSWYIQTSTKGIIRICIDQTGENREWYPWVWWERSSDVRLKHQWSSDEWTYSGTMNDGKDGTYTLTTQYPTNTGGYNYSDYSSNGSYDVGYIETPTIQGSPKAGDKCLFTLNTNTPSLTITRLYTITYNGNGHTGGTVPRTVDKKHGTNITLSSSTPTRTGYTFVGWNTKADGTGTTYAAGATYSTNADVTLYAQWEIREDKIALWAGSSGSFGTNASGEKIRDYVLYIQYGTNTFYTKDDQGNKTYVTAPMPSHSNPKKYCRGYYLGGDTAKLVIDKYGKLCKGVKNGDRYTDDNGNWVYTGNFIQTSVTAWYSDKYPVELDANSGIWTSTGRKVTYVVYNQMVPDITGGSSSLPWKTGYTFDGYYVNADGTGDKYYDKDGKGLLTWTFSNTAANIIEKLYANYTPTVYNITYDNLGDATHTNPATYTIETPTISFAAPTKDRTGYTFKNWSPSSIAKGSTNNKTITAQWTANTYTVTLNQQSGTGGTTSVTATYDAAMPAITKPTRNGYTFGGYYTATNGGGTQYYNANGASSKNWDKTAATTLYAKWTANQYTITWNANGGSVTPTSSTYIYDGDPVTLPTPTRTGYEFNGWFTASTGGTRISDVGKTNKPTSNTTYYAQWKAKTYIVTLDPQGGFSGSNSINATYDATLPAITPPTRDGYIFEGYYSEPNGQGKKYYNADGSSANLWDKENATLYAKWVEYAKCIFFKNNVGWNNVYIYTFINNAWLNEDNGDNKRGVNPKVNKLEHGKMTKLNNESDIYYYILTQEKGFNHIAFSEKDMRGYTTFYESKASYRSDRSDQMPLFIPKNEVNDPNVNATDYYNNGVWMKYNSTESGYRLNIMGEGGTFFTATEPGGYVFTATVHLSTKNPYKLDITTLQSEKKFSNANYMTSNNCTGWTMDDWNWETESTWGINPTLVGEYTFTMNLAEGKVSVSATYPTLTETVGDYRLLYVEQVVEKSKVSGDEWKTIITRKKAHPSDIIKQSELASEGKIVSLHIYKDRKYSANAGGGNVYESFSNPEIILQQCTAVVNNKSQWKDIERHMVYGPLETLPSMAMAPGRRNAAAEETTATLIYDDGIEIIKHDENNGNGVWNFTVKASGSTATIDLSKTERYPLTTGNYYIRTTNAEGGWHNYKIDANKMTYSEYATNNKEFTHYFCKWIDINEYGSKNVQFVIANDYGQAISDTIVADRATLFGVALDEDERMVEDNGLLPASANVRFSWKEDNNALHRAYIDGAGSSKEYLVLKDLGKKLFKFNSSANNLTNDTVTFLDNGGWMYQVDVYSKTNSPINLTAKYNDKTQYFKGEAARATTNLIGGNPDDDTKYPIRILYDFKENHLITGYVPQVPETKDVAIETNLMMIRKNHGAANQLTMNLNSVGKDGVAVNTGYDAYGVITFTKDHLAKNDDWTVTNAKTFYWISFPFDVNLKDVFGFGKYAYHWYLEYYDGKSRADNGLFYESGTYWKYVMEEDAHDFVLRANQGYVIWLNVPLIQTDNFFTDITKEISIYFPSANKIANNFQTKSETITLEPMLRPEGSRRYNDDSNWRLIGVPSYANTAATTTQGNINFVYVYDAEKNDYNVTKTIGDLEGDCFQSMHAYMIQYAGDIHWTTVVNEYPSQLAAKQNSNGTKEQYVLRLELLRNDSKEDQTYLHMQDENVTAMFDMNYDLCKIINAGANIYSIIHTESDPIQVAANALPIANTVIPIGVQITAAGEYTFAMPEGTDGIVVELIDYQANTTTNLLFNDYTVSLSKGTFENRFALSVKPDKTATSLENIFNEATGDEVKKFIIDGILYMQKDGVLYDAQGHIVR